MQSVDCAAYNFILKYIIQIEDCAAYNFAQSKDCEVYIFVCNPWIAQHTFLHNPWITQPIYSFAQSEDGLLPSPPPPPSYMKSCTLYTNRAHPVTICNPISTSLFCVNNGHSDDVMSCTQTLYGQTSGKQLQALQV